MKIAYVCSEYPPAPHGGIGTFVQTMAHAMTRRGHEVTVVGIGNRDEVRDDCGARVIMLRGTRLGRGISGLADRWKIHGWLARAVARRRTEIVEVPDYAGLLPMPFEACPVAVRLHMSGTILARQAAVRPRRVLSLCEQRTFRWHRSWIAVSKHVLGLTVEAFRVKPSACRVIYNPAAIPDENGSAIPTGLPRMFVLFAGTVCGQKGAYALALAARRFLAVHPDLHLVYAGKVVDENGIQSDQRIRAILGEHLARRVVFLGALERRALAACMKKAQIFAFPSQLEAFGLVVAEAMLSRLAVVVPDDGPFPEFVQHERTGLLVPPHNEEALSESVERLLNSEALRTELGANAARDVSKRFSVDKCASESEDFYAELLAGR